MGADLVLIYGPPAAGKLTVANALSELTGYVVLHNHLTRDLVRTLPLGPEAHDALVERLRFTIVEEVLHAGFGLILTTAIYPHPSIRPFVEGLEERVASAGGRMHRAQLCPDVQTLERRVVEATRASHAKLRTVEALRKALAEQDWYAKVAPDDLSVDNSLATPKEVATLLSDQFGLRSAQSERSERRSSS